MGHSENFATRFRSRLWPDVTLLAVTCLFLLAKAALAKGIDIGESLKDTYMSGLNGDNRNLRSYFGQPLVINVWASWCAPCRKEMQSLEALADQLKPSGTNVIGISTDDDASAAKAFLKATGGRIRHYRDQDLILENMLGADRIPLTLLIDARGKVLRKYYGEMDWANPTVARSINRILRSSSDNY